MSDEDRSPEGRRVLVARVTGEPGERIQAWRQLHDPQQACRLPPHATLCYWAPAVDPDIFHKQVRHAFDGPLTVRLGSVHAFDNPDHTFYIDVKDTQPLDAARQRLYDGTYLELPGRTDWTWHVTCVRKSRGRNLAELRAAATTLEIDMDWVVNTISYLELRGDHYETVTEWQVG